MAKAGEEPTESTSTLVLSSPSSSFVDLRILLPSSESSTAPVKPPDSTIKAVSNCSLDIESSSLSRLDWGFAGTSTRSTDQSSTRGKWHHWVDSTVRNADAESIVDEAELFSYSLARYNPLGLPGEATEAMKSAGSEILELEKGSMLYPRTGQVTEYEEVWGDSIAVPALEGGTQAICIVMKTVQEESGSDVRGLVVRVGQWCQGILRRGGDVVAERWVMGNGLGWIRKDETEWRRVARLGSEELSLPCDKAWDAGACLQGDVFDYGKAVILKWRVEEVAKWESAGLSNNR